MNSAPDWLIAAQRRTRAEQCQFRQMRSRDIFAEEKVVCGGEGAAVVRLEAALRSRTEYWFSRLVNFAVEGRACRWRVEVCDMVYTCTHVNSVCHFLEGLLSIIFRRETGV